MSDDLRLPVLTGRAWCFADRLAAVDILPARFAALPPDDAIAHLFADVDPDLACRVREGDVLVAGRHTGHGDGGLAAVRALAAAGFVAIVAGGFADGFDHAAIDAGLAPLEVDAPAIFHTGQRMRLNLEGATVANLSSGDRQPVRNLSEALLERLRAAIGR